MMFAILLAKAIDTRFISFDGKMLPMNTRQVQRKNKETASPKRRLTPLHVLVGLVILVIIAALGPMMIASNGAENYTGVKHEAALNVLAADRSAYSPGFAGITTRPHVDKIEPSPQGRDRFGNLLRCTDNPEDIQYYSVTLRRIGLFGTTYLKSTYDVCNTAG